MRKTKIFHKVITIRMYGDVVSFKLSIAVGWEVQWAYISFVSKLTQTGLGDTETLKYAWGAFAAFQPLAWR